MADDALCLVEHLCLAYPKSSSGNSHGKVVYLYAVELVDVYLYGIVEKVEVAAAEQFLYHFVLHSAQRNVCLGEEITGATGGVEELQRRKLLLEVRQTAVSLLCYFLFLNVLQLTFEFVEKQRVDNLVYVLY